MAASKSTGYRAAWVSIADWLSNAWPDVTVNRATVRQDSSEYLAEGEVQISVDLSVSGEPEALVARGLVSSKDLKSLPKCGIGRRRGRHIQRNRSGRVRVELYVLDPPYDHIKATDEFDMLVTALAPYVWSFPHPAK